MQIHPLKFILLSALFLLISCSQKEDSGTSAVVYTISFENAVHHEAEVNVSFTEIPSGAFAFRMSRTSPGRYALHEFAKNVYNVKATNSKGEVLEITRPDPYQWKVENHDGTVHVSYTIFANRGDGTYAQIDETHAHLNIPATFMYSSSQSERPVEITFQPRKDLNWKIATQLKKESENNYWAPNLQYFMDSPTELSNHSVRSFKVGGNDNKQTIKFALHHNGTETELDDYFEKVKAVVLQEEAVFGELPNFDFGEYIFLACYIPNASGDGMEHRNSTILTSTSSLANGFQIATVSHEFFHAWNVERIRPLSLEPFDFEEANMSGELWFAEGFTSYYTWLMLCRSGIIKNEQYINQLSGGFNYVWNSPGTSYFNPIEMSYQAPFVDAAKSVDPVNRTNTFISYYTYGSMLGLGLDLSLRNLEGNLNLDDYMKAVWDAFGKNETPYTINNLHQALNTYAGKEFGDNFFQNYIYKSDMPNYKDLFASVGISLEQKSEKGYFGPYVSQGIISGDPTVGSPAYKAGFDKGDKIISVNGEKIIDKNSFSSVLNKHKPNDVLTITFLRFGKEKTLSVKLAKDTRYSITPFEKEGMELTDSMKQKRAKWLNKK